MAAPSYPLTPPSTPAYKDAKWSLVRKASVSESPFTGAQQIYEYNYALWSATLTLPPMKRSQAAEWEAFLMKLHGRLGTFVLENPDYTLRGTASGNITTGADVAVGDHTITLSTTQNSQANIFRAGDYFQIGTGGSAKLHMIVDDASTDSSGNVDVNIEPAIKVALNSGQVIEYTNPKGVFRMQSNDLGWDTNEVSVYGISFACMEAI